jgi:cytochrome c556
MKMLKPVSCVLLAGTLFAGVAPLHAEVDNANAWISYRESLMETLKYHSKAARKVAKGSPALPLNTHLLAHARAMRDAAGFIPDLFPQGSDFGETEAKDAVWEDREGFDAAAKKLADALDTLVKAAEADDRDAAGKALKQVGKACKGCHDDYREEEE